MKSAARICGFILFLFIAQNATSLDVQFYPADALYVNTANARFQVHDLVAHLVVIKNTSKAPITLDELGYQLFSKEKLIQELYVTPEQLVSASEEVLKLQQQGLPMLANALCPPEALGKEGKLVSKKNLLPGEALTSRNIFMTSQTLPTSLKVVAKAKTSDGKEMNASAAIRIVQYESKNSYVFPLKGQWYLQAVPNVTSHHRWMFQTEFGIDFLKVNAEGSLFKTDGKRATDYYAFGEPVLAAADGIVVRALGDAVQNWDAWFPRKQESEEDFERRLTQYQMEALKQDVYKAITGNLIVIQHPNKEYSSYAHLKTGSLQVKVGDRVTQGQKIAEVGDTGDHYRPHLHFQISNGNDLLNVRSLPFEFSNLESNKPELGHFGRIKNSTRD